VKYSVLLAVTSAACSFTPGTAGSAAGSGDADIGDADLTDAGPDAPARVTGDLVALYTFEEGSGTQVLDRSGFGAPLDLVIPDVSKVVWGVGSLTVTEATLIASPQTATKVLDACRDVDGVTLEAWFQPAAIASGYPRVVSLATNNSDLAITLMARDSRFEFRMRGPLTDSNGLPSLNSPDGTVQLQRTHVALVSAPDGTRTLYVDGIARATDVRGGDLASWGTSHRFGLASELDGVGSWLGTYHLVAIYARALTAAEVATHFALGP
jgi:hypothetical protein